MNPGTYKTAVLLGLISLIAGVTPLYHAAQASRPAEPQLTNRYEGGASENELTEAAFRLAGLESAKRAKVAIRVCSKEPLNRALADARANAFHFADKLINGYAYEPEKVLFLRDSGCLSSKDPAAVPIEIWTIPEGGDLPPHNESFASNRIRLVSLGKLPGNGQRGVRDYRAAVRDLIANLHDNPQNLGVVLGYFLEQPSAQLKQRMRELTFTLKRSNLQPRQYVVKFKPWPDEVSTYPPDSEPQYPSVFLIETTR